jgi:hypothetical protein
MLLRGLEVGMAKQVGRYADLLGRAVDQLGHGAVAEEMGPNVPAEGVAGAFFDLVPYRRAVHRPTVPTEPKVTLDADLPLSRSN